MLLKEKIAVKNIKRYLTILLLLIVFAISATGCTGKNISGANGSETSGTQPFEAEKTTRVYDSVGINIPADDIWKKYFNDLDDDGGVMLFEDKVINGYLYFYFSTKEDAIQKKNLFLIAICSKARSLNETKVAELMMFNHAEKLGGNDELDYLFCWNDRDTKGLSEANKDKYNQLYDDMPNMKKLIQFSEADPKTFNDEWKNGNTQEKGLIEIPAGKVREFENIYECLKREIKEETGLEVIEIEGEREAEILEINGYKVLNYVPFSNSQNLKGRYPIMVQVFICKVKEGKLKQSKEAKNIRWVSLGELQRMLKEKELFYPMHITTMKKYLRLRKIEKE